MNNKKLCRNFQRGSCQYGERCKFLHSNQQQPKPNAFGFGTQANSHQQQKPNPFGFGVQSNAQLKGTNDFGNKQNQLKKNNTWTRSSANNGAPSSRQPDNQAQTTNHTCNDPESCKRIIAEDFQNERPLWKLTCYSHWKNSPCDIVGDVSYEELRAAAYDEAKRGISLQSIIERERNLQKSKLAEFENFLRNPYRGPAGSTPAQHSPFPAATAAGFSPPAQNTVAPQNSFPPAVSSFSQLGASLNTGFPQRPSVQSNNAFGRPTSFSNSPQPSNAFATNNAPSANAFSFGNQQPTSFSNSSQPSNAFATNNAPSTNAFSFGNQQPTSLPNSSQPSNAFATNNAPSANAFSFGNQQPTSLPNSSQPSNAFATNNAPSANAFSFGNQQQANQPVAASFPTSNFGNTSAINPSINLSSSSIQSPAGFNVSLSNNGQAATNLQSGNNLPRDVVSGDSSIWLKDKWTPGEIPEEAPPDAYV